MSTKEIFEEGVQSFAGGKWISPYTACSIEYFFWKSGWEAALQHALVVGERPTQLGCMPVDE